MEHSEEFHNKLCFYCFANLENIFEKKESLEYPAEFDTQEYPLFVTYEKDDRLRGCIGTFKADKLGKNLQSYSLIAALKDSRFSPITPKEFP